MIEQPVRQPKPHPFFDKHTVICTILMIIGSYILVMFPASVFMGVLCFVLRITDIQSVLFLGVVPMALLVLLVYRLWFRPEFRGILFSGFFKTLRFAAAMPVFWLVLCLPDLLNGNYPQTFNLQVLSLGLTAGFSEEVVFRGLPLSYLKRQLRSEKQVPLIVFVTGGIFGLVHVSNILFGASVSASLVQGVATSCIGIFLGAVFIRGGNVFVPILLHSLHDMFVLSFQAADEVSVTIEREAETADIFSVLICLGLAIFGLFLIRKSKRSEICRLWAGKWSQTTENLPETPAETISETTGGQI
ncbi:MAG: CPBP family intramembrane metalloprotease [Oscillospiraceae bacterium]|nr:CPBP family intramembrane metalloprotease [Oscillospiraceae bacterium]